MKFPPIIASGQGLIPFLFLGVPAAIIGVACLIVAATLASKKKTEDKKTVRKLSIIGVLLIAFLFISPSLDPITNWVIERSLKSAGPPK